ncbi:MAG: nucleoid-associated protein [Phycisphaerae bacterium]|jgi:DNA-binding YbaB/EbfC family protein|nr:MAG: nucleoid-associated protein [Phycisphaerae bacterium]
MTSLACGGQLANTGDMFDVLKNLGNLPGLMARAKEMQEKMRVVQEELARKQFTADAAAGAVTAVVNGRLEVVKVRIDKQKIDPTDTELLEDLIVAAISAAQSKAASGVQEEMMKLTAGLGLPPGMIPGT